MHLHQQVVLQGASGRSTYPKSLRFTAPKTSRGNLRFMSQFSVADILELPVQERIQLVEVIWESIAAFPDAIEVSPELKTELNARLADFERNPEAGYSWDQVKAHIRSGSWRTA
jgi:putative addiction module component (TIGR02574 family)